MINIVNTCMTHTLEPFVRIISSYPELMVLDDILRANKIPLSSIDNIAYNDSGFLVVSGVCDVLYDTEYMGCEIKFGVNNILIKRR